MRRGDIVTVAAPGAYGKPRPAVVIQGDALNQHQPGSTIVALMISSLLDAP
jgi:mRNA interferase MazF